MVNKFKTILDAIEKQKGAVNFFAVMKMDNFLDKWSVAIAADWINKNNDNKTFSDIYSIFTKFLTLEEAASLARIGLFTNDGYIPQLFKQYQSNTKLENQKINGFQIYEAYIIKSNLK